jgi:hypothetical protein
MAAQLLWVIRWEAPGQDFRSRYLMNFAGKEKSMDW